MALAQQLYVLQTVDLALAAKQKRLAEVEASLGESDELRQAQEAAIATQEKIEQTQKQQRELEAEAKSLDARIEQIEQRLYSGTVRNPKELQSMQDDLTQWQRIRRHLEDRLLETMMALEEAQAEGRNRREILAAVESAWRTTQAGLLAEQVQLQAEIEQLTRRRQTLVANLSPTNVERYERLRNRLGRAVSQLRGGVCEVCGVTVPTGVVGRVGAGDNLIACPNCERLLTPG